MIRLLLINIILMTGTVYKIEYLFAHERIFFALIFIQLFLTIIILMEMVDSVDENTVGSGQ